MRKLKKNDETQELFNEVAGIKDELAEVSELAAFLCKFDKNHIEHRISCGSSVKCTICSRFVYKNKIKEIRFDIIRINPTEIQTIANNENDYLIKIDGRYFKVMKDNEVYMEVTEFFAKEKTCRMNGGCLGLVTEESEENT